MTLIKWKPRPMSIFDDMDNMVNSVFNADWNLPENVSSKWSPAVDVNETDNSFTITADIPGLVKKDIEVNISNDVLTISSNKEYSEDSNTHFNRLESLEVNKSFYLPEDIDAKKIDAQLKNGILEITIPRKTPIKTKTKKITIK